MRSFFRPSSGAFAPSAFISGRLLLILVCACPASSVRALPPHETGDGTPQEPCLALNFADAVPALALQGLPLTGCSVDINAGGSKIELIKLSCHDPTYYDLPNSMPVSWQLISWPGSPAPTFTSSSTLATLSLPRAGTYVVRFTICPSGGCSFRPQLGGTNYPIATASATITIVAVNSIPIPVEEYPILPASANAATQPVTIPSKECKCQGGGGVLDPQWVTVLPWSGPNDYKLLEGSVFKAHIAVQDDFLDHDTHDVDFNVIPDKRYNNLVSSDSLHDEHGQMAVEYESGSYPERFRPTYGDRVSVFGFWIIDCGHPPYFSEIHPPVGVVVDRPRPIQIPSGKVFDFTFSDGTVSSTVGNNVYVPGILTDLWFNKHSGENTRCGGTSLHQPGVCNICDPPQQNCPPWVGGSCIQAPLSLNRIFEFNIYLPRNPAVSARQQGLGNAPTPPLYVAVSNPWGFGGPEPVITPVTEGDVTYLHVTLDLRGYGGDNYSRRIESAWVYPAPDNWGLARWHVSFPTLDVHDDQDPWTDWPGDDGDYRFWMTINNRDQEWTRILWGDDNAHGTMYFTPAWQSGSGDPVFWRQNQKDLDSSHRLGPDVLAYPDQGVQIHTTAYESDAIWDDDPGRTYAVSRGPSVQEVLSDQGNYSIHFLVTPGPPVGAATLTATATRLNNALRLVCNNNGSRFNMIRALLAAPLEAKGFIVPGIADQTPWTVEGNTVAARLGTAVAGVGDVNGDGFADVLIGAPGAGPNGVGEVSLYLGHPQGMSSTAFWMIDGDMAGSGFGGKLASAGDVNGDGFDDFIVGAPTYSRVATNGGAVFLWLGGPSSNAPAVNPDWMVKGGFPGAEFGFSLASGDVNGDGLSDVVVGAPYYQNSISASVPLGRVFIYLGSSNGLAATPAITLVPTSVDGFSLHWFGYSVAVADVDHNAFADVIVGAPRYDNGLTDQGAIFVYPGSAPGVSTTPIRTLTGGVANAQFGFAVAAAGDVNGDSFQDVLVGAPLYTGDDVTVEEGFVALFLGSNSSLNLPAAWGTSGGWGGAHSGSSLAGVGDLNGDGLADFIIGSPDYTGTWYHEGRFQVYLGATNVSKLTPIWTKASEEAEAQFSFAVSGAGDVNGDGFSDFLIGAPGFNSDTHEGMAYFFQGQGQREINPRDDPFMESVDPEANAFYNLRDPNFGNMLKATGQDDPVKLDQMLTALRAKITSELMGTSRESDAMAALAQLRLFVPTNVWEQHFGDLQVATGGALYLNCGGTNETVDALGRRWKPDSPFLTTSDSFINPFNGQSVDTSLLSDTNIPNSVLLGERWKDGDLNYEIPIENGPHTVILYFSENCSACVSTNFGGTGPNGAGRIFDVEVEGWRTNGYNQADAAMPPSNDGIGATFKATQLDLPQCARHRRRLERIGS